MTNPYADISQRKPPSLGQAVFYSLLAHLMVVLFIVISPMLPWSLSGKEKPLDIVWMELPKGTGEDITGIQETKTLPENTIQETKEIPEVKDQKEPTQPPPQQVAKAPEKKPVEPKKNEMSDPTNKKTPPKNKEPKRAEFGDAAMKKALAKIDKQLAGGKTPQAAQMGGEGEGYKYGTSDKPLRISRGDPAFLKYQAQVRSKIMGNWISPGKFAEGAKIGTARVHVTISASGSVLSTRWVRRSGDGSVDESALRAIQRASPFPTPPEALKWEALNEGFLVEFDPKRARR